MMAAMPPEPAGAIGIVSNPNSGVGNARRIAGRIQQDLEARGLSAVHLNAPSAAACAEGIRRRRGDLRALLLVGGDGLVSAAINTEEARSLPIGLIPVGTGNDFARHLGVPIDRPLDALAQALATLDRSVSVDLGHITGPGVDILFAGALSFGFDAAVNRRANALHARFRRYKYQVALLLEVFSYGPRDLRIELDGVARDFSGMLATVLNIRSFGGGIRVAPHASIRDGRLDLLTVSRLSRFRFLRLLPTLLTGTHVKRPEVKFRSVTDVTLEAAGVEAYADGEPVGRDGPFRITVKPGAIRVLGVADGTGL